MSLFRILKWYMNISEPPTKKRKTKSSSLSSEALFRGREVETVTGRLFTIEEVEKIVEEAVRQKEEEIRKEYDEMLINIQEQCQSFIRFHEDSYFRRDTEESSYIT